MKIDQRKFWQFRETIRHQYEGIKEIYCPYLHETVKFSSDGFRHLLYKKSSPNRRRSRNEQYSRLDLFRLAPKLLKITTTVQEFNKEKQFITIKANNRREKILKEVTYWGFIAIIEGKKIKVIVKQIGNGSKRFWSIIPNWITRKSREQITRVHHYGDLELTPPALLAQDLAPLEAITRSVITWEHVKREGGIGERDVALVPQSF